MIKIISEKFVDKKSKKFPEGYWLWECDISDELIDLVKLHLGIKKRPTKLQLEKFIVDSLVAACKELEEEKCCDKCKCGKK